MDKVHGLFSSFCGNLFLLLVLVSVRPNLAVAGSVVKFLPGFEGPLPFELETGYIGVGESEDVQLFYYFVKSQSNPQTDPLLIWLSGGPGCSSFRGLACGIGPLKFQPVPYNGTLPKLVTNPHSWTKVASIIFLDSPVGTGFSYARTAKASQSTDLQASEHNYEFLRKWLHDNPEYISNSFYIGGDSYSGITVPILAQLVSNGNVAGIEPHIHLKGYILGNPAPTTQGDGNHAIPFAHRMALISNELYESLKVTCKGEYVNIDPSNAPCLKNIQAYNKLIDNINPSLVLEPTCPAVSPKSNNLFSGRRSTVETFYKKFEELDVLEFNPVQCRAAIGQKLPDYWANDTSVQEALHVLKGTIKVWVGCNYSILYTKNAGSVVPYHANLSTKGYRSLIYSGDHDMLLPYLGTEDWIRSLSYPIIDDWRQWIHQGQVAGYTRTYANKMTFATVKGAGHIAPYNKPAECRSMFGRWISYQPL
ncbi:serine carboxypeptidase-like 2 [Coffea eugenioides]|uniref:serine carboxypeptidase-like 2 n=1 Tax=Coffea eugenioides TaxID=49369 RepID=UPI000F614A4F|nr:serine carboxypeptidase-like 2 [Coffea eugenioides]